jgi:hypothetical protein
VQDFRFSQQCCWKLECSGMWCCVVALVVPDVSWDCNAFIFKVKQSKQTWAAWPWRWRHYDLLNHWELLAERHSITSQKTYVIVKGQNQKIHTHTFPFTVWHPKVQACGFMSQLMTGHQIYKTKFTICSFRYYYSVHISTSVNTILCVSCKINILSKSCKNCIHLL